jgi:SAM-dependent methyltransferase
MIPQAALNDPGWHQHYLAMQARVDYFIQQGYINPVDFIDKNVLDFGGSAGQLAIALLERGAKTATVIDTSLPVYIYDNLLNSVAGLTTSSILVEEFSDKFPAQFDFVIAHSVTEHVAGIGSVFSAIKKLMTPNAKFFIAHDNYYHPSGAHDNFMLRCGSHGIYEYQGPKCWESEDTCAFSLDYRNEMRQKFGMAWSADMESALSPVDCQKCPFFRRTHPWSHLIWQDEFRNIFKEPMFKIGLNKITPFQLHQFLIEAGFEINLSKRAYVNNEPPELLTGEPFFLSYQDLKTVNVYVLAS